MLEALLTIVVVLLIVGVLLWAISAFPYIDASMKQLARIAIIVIACIWVIVVLFGAATHTRLLH